MRLVPKLSPDIEGPYKRQAQALIDARSRARLSKNKAISGSGVARPVYYGMEKGTLRATPESLERLTKVFSPEDVDAIRSAAEKDVLDKAYGPREDLDQDAGAVNIGGVTLVRASALAKKPPKPDEGLQPLKPEGLRQLPRFESVACGWGAVTEDHPAGWDWWPADLASDADHTITARGDSMTDVGIDDGDRVFVRKVRVAPRKIPSGTTVIARLDGDEYTCKKLYHDRTVSWLQGAADGWRNPIYLHERPEIKIVGVVTGVYKPMGIR